MKENNVEDILQTEVTTEPKSMNQWSVWAIIFLAVLMPLFFLPAQFSTFLASKTFIFSLLTLFASFVLIVSHLRKNELKLPINLVSLALILIPLIYFLSSLATSNWRHAFWGDNFSINSALFVSMLILLVFVTSITFKDATKTLTLYFSLTLSFVLTLILVIINILPGEALGGLNFFFTNTTNTVGKWFDLGIFSATVLILSLLSIEFLKLSKISKILLFIIIGLSMALLAVIGFANLWLLILITTLLVFVYLITINRFHTGQNKFNFPKVTLTVFILSFVFLISNNLISTEVQEKLYINDLDVRLSLLFSNEMISKSIMKEPYLGFGPNNFSDAFNLFKTQQVNVNDYGMVNFTSAYGYLYGVPVSAGILGTLAWLFLLGCFLYFGVKSALKKTENTLLRYVNISSFFVTLFLWLSIIFYNSGIVILVLFAIFLGLFIASIYEMEILKNKKILITKNPKTGFIYVFILVTLLLGSIMVEYVYFEKFLADYHYVQASNNISKNDLVGARDNLVRAIQFDQSQRYLFDYSDLMNLNISNLLNNPNVSEADKANMFREFFAESIRALQTSAAINPEDHQSYQKMGNIFSSMMDLKVNDAYTEAKNAYEKALTYSPQNPSIYLALAQIEMKNNNRKGAENYIRKSLEVKPNYVDAIFYYSQMQIQAGQTEEAIQSAELALVVRPNDPAVYFQLGVLNYETARYSRAIEHFEKAVILNPNFMNARYFLGLSYARENRKSDAIGQFEILKKLSPNNQEIDQILKNLRNNISIFGQVAEPEEEEEETEELPLEEQETEE